MRILLGVCGGIAAYKAAGLTSTLVQRGDEVDVILTREARRFIGRVTFAALSHRDVHDSLWTSRDALAHISLVREAGVFVIAPATANTIAKLALGLADDLLTNCALAATIPIVVAPAMNSAMYEHSATQEHLETLRARGATIVAPDEGFLAEREHGVGRLAAESAVISAIDAAARRSGELAGRSVVVTAGPTREPIDPVRFLSNGSSGATGIEIAREALRRGASVELILGPTQLRPPSGANVRRVTTALEMHAATLAAADGADMLIATAAVADWRPAQTHDHKVKKSAGGEPIELVRNPDILAEIGAHKNGTFLVGFAAETDDPEGNGREKIAAKRLDAIAVNDVSAGKAFGTPDNDLVLLWGANGRRDLGRGSKPELARRLLDAIAELRCS